MNLKSERLKKLESELADLEQWLKLGLVPKKDIEKHKEEIASIQEKIEEEKDRLRFIKESGDVEEYTPPKRTGRQQSYQEPQSMPDMPAADETEGGNFDMDTTSFDTSTGTGEDTTSTTSETSEEEMSSQIYEEDEDPFSDKNRWKRGIWEDPDADQW